MSYVNKYKKPNDNFTYSENLPKNDEKFGSILSNSNIEYDMTLRSSNNNFGETLRNKRESSNSFFNPRTSESYYVQESKSVVLDKFSALRNESIGQRLKKQDDDCYNQIKKKQDFMD